MNFSLPARLSGWLIATRWTVVISGVAVALFLGSIPACADVWVALEGSDSNPGTASRPFATFERARDALRAAPNSAGTQAGSKVVWIRGGDYVRTRALELGAEDGGTYAAPVIWRAEPGKRVRWIGGLALPAVSTNSDRPGWKAVTDKAVLERLDPEARARVVQLDVKSLGATDLGVMKSRGFSRATTPSHGELFADGRPMILARWPNEGQFAKIAGFPDTAGKGDDHGGTLGALEAGFHYEGDRPKRWKQTAGVWVHGYWAWDWANSYEQVVSMDLGTRLVRTAPPHGLYGFRKGQRFHFLNVLEELDQPGEWYLEATSGQLYFWPPADLSPNAEVQFSQLQEPFLKFNAASNVMVHGMEFLAARGTGIEIRGGRSVRVDQCVLRNLGNSGVVVEGGFDHGVSSCEILDTGDGGVSLSGGDRQTLTPGGHFVENTHFQRQGRWSKCYVPAVSLTGVGLRASNNHIHDHPHCAILFWGNDHLMDYNDIHHIALETGDVGAIYTGRDYSFRGNRIRHNYIHETGGVGMGSMGVYMDDCVSGTEVFGNIFYKVHWAMFIGGGRDHRVENNLFVDCDPGVRMDGRGLDKSPVWHGMVTDYMRKQLAAVPAELYRRRYPAIRDLDPFYADPSNPGIPPENNLVVRNVCSGKWLDVGWHSKTNHLRLEDNLVVDDPGFVDRGALDFRLKPDSTAWNLGFQRIPVERIGIQGMRVRP